MFNNHSKTLYKILLFINLLLAQSMVCQNNTLLNSEGTFIIAAICLDGIVVGSDSRSANFNDKGEIVAYFEESPKIYAHKNIIMAVAGLRTFKESNLTFSGLFKKFQAYSMFFDLKVGEFYSDFLNYAKMELSPNEHFRLKQNQFIVCGYNHDRPIIYYYHNTDKDTINIIGYITNYKKDNNWTEVNNYLKGNFLNATSQFIQGLLENVIRKRNKDEVSKIGGPISIALVKPNRIIWISRYDKNDAQTESEFYKLFINNRIKFWYRSKSDSIYLRESYKFHYD